MSYRVIWRERLRSRLHQLTFLALEYGGDADAAGRAVEEINHQLEVHPASVGESRDGAERVLIVHPLSVFYEVFESQQVVMIYSAVYYPGRRA